MAAASLISGADDTERAEADAALQQLSEELQSVEELRAAYVMAEFGRRTKSPEALLAAARVLASTPIEPLEPVSVESDAKEETESPAGSAYDEAQRCISEARELAQTATGDEQKAIEALADAIAASLEEQARGAVGGPKSIFGAVGPLGTTSYQLDLIGGFTTINVTSLSGADLNVRVVGSLTGLEYGSDYSPFQNASVNFSHLPVAKVTVVVSNASQLNGQFTLTTN
jgi:hypothetical protein